VKRETALGLLKVVPLQGITLTRDLGLIYHRDKYLDPAMEGFLKVVRELQPKLSG
jgi:DNA-binding transcriptional LysR family regulator